MAKINKNKKKSEGQKKDKTRKFWLALIILAFLLGIGVRLYDLQDAPLDFHPTRQLHSALIARGMYYQTLEDAPDWQKEMAYDQWQTEGLIEPQIMERLTAFTFQLMGEVNLWAARLWSIFFWTLGGVFLCLLVNQLFGLAGASIAAVYFMLWPYAVISSRAFQPESLMVAAIIVGLWAAVRWIKEPTFKRAAIAGILCGLAIYIKSIAVFFIAPALAGLLLTNFNLKELIKNKQVWLIFALSVTPFIAYYFYGVYILGTLGGQFSLRFFPNLWIDPVFYLQWINEIKNVIGLEIFLTAIAGLLVFPKKHWRGMLLGLLAGYIIYGFTLSYHISTHDYYQMPLLPVVAMGLAAIFDFIIRNLPKKKLMSISAFFLVLIAFMVLKTWDARVTLKKIDYHNETRFWEKLGDQLGHESQVTGLMSDYGYRLAYWGWVDVSPWLQISDINLRELAGQEIDLDEAFHSAIEGKDYFVITLMDEFERQPDLKYALDANYPLIEFTDEVRIYDLNANLK